MSEKIEGALRIVAVVSGTAKGQSAQRTDARSLRLNSLVCLNYIPLLTPLYN